MLLKNKVYLINAVGNPADFWEMHSVLDVNKGIKS